MIMTINDIITKEDLTQVSDELHQFSAEEFNTIVEYIKQLGQVVFSGTTTSFNLISGMPNSATDVFVNTGQSEAKLKFTPRFRKTELDVANNPIVSNINGSAQATITVKNQNYDTIATLTSAAIFNVVNEVNVPQLLNAGTYYVDVDMTVEYSGQQSSANIQFVVTSTALGIQLATEGVNWHLPWKQYTRYSIGPYIITGSLDKTLHLKISNGTTFRTVEVNLGTDSYSETPYSYQLSSSEFLGNSEQVTIEAWLTANTIETNHVSYNIAAIKSGANDTAVVLVINNLADSIPGGQSTNVFDYCIYSGNNATTSIQFKESVYEGEELYSEQSSTAQVSCQTKLSYNTNIAISSDSPDISAVFELGYGVSYINTKQFTIPIDNSDAVPYVAGATFVMNPAKKRNGDSEKSIKNAAGTNKWNYTSSNLLFADNVDGWTVDENGRNALVIPAKARLTFNKNLFANITTNVPKVIDITYRAANVSDDSEPIISICNNRTSNNFVGLKITPSRVVLHSNNKNNPENDYMQGTTVPDEQTINVQICLCPNYNITYGNFAFIYVNGVKKTTFTYTGDSFALNSSSIILGSDNSDLYVYSIKEYDDPVAPFSFSQALNNYYSSLGTNNKQQYKQFDDEIIDSTASGVTVSYDKMVQLINTVRARNFFVVSLEDESNLPKYGKSKDSHCQCDLEMYYDNGYAFKLTNQRMEGQGTTSMNYWLWNFRWRIDKNSGKKCGVSYSSDWGSTWDNQGQQGSVEFASGKTGVKRITAKKNYASSMQSHKIGSTKAYNDLHDEVVGENEAEARVAVYQYPAYGFMKTPAEGGGYIYKFIGLYTIGPDKGDKHTFGYDNAQYADTYVQMEGIDHNTLLTLFKYPWNAQVGAYANNGDLNVAINLLNNNYQSGWEVGALHGLETDNTKTEYDAAAVNAALEAYWKPAYEVAYLNNPFIKGLDQLQQYSTIADINNNIDQFNLQRDENDRPLSHFEIYDNNYDLYYFDLRSNSYQPTGVNVRTDLDVSTSTLNGKTPQQKNEYFIQKRVERFKANVGKYWDVNDCLFHQQFCFIIGATDNNAKNTYPYSFNPEIQNGEAVCKWRWRQDDLDTIFDIDNQGVPRKNYSIELEDFTNSSHTAYVFKGEDSAFWTLFSLAYDKYDENKTADVMGNRILTEMCNIVNGNTYEEKLMNFFQTYYWDNAQDYFSRSAYNADAKISYEDAFPKYGNQYSVDTNPLEQSLGDHKEAEKDWVRKRIVYCMSKYKFGPFSNYESTEAGRITFRTQTPRRFTLTPAMDLYPTVIAGQDDVRKSPNRIFAGATYTTDNMGSNNTNIYIPAANYLQDIGDLKDLVVDSAGNPALSVQSKQLKRIKIGDADSALVSTNIQNLTLGQCPQLTDIDARNLTSLVGIIDLSTCNRIEHCLLSGTNVTQLNVQNANNLTELSIPETLTRLSIINAPRLTESGVTIDNSSQQGGSSWDNLSYIRIENASIGILNYIFTRESNYNASSVGIRLIGINDTVSGSAVKNNNFYTLKIGWDIFYASPSSDGWPVHGIDSEGQENRKLFPIITGTAIVDNEGIRNNTPTPSRIENMRKAFPNLDFVGDIALYDTDSNRITYTWFKNYFGVDIILKEDLATLTSDTLILPGTPYTSPSEDLPTHDVFPEFKYCTGVTTLTINAVRPWLDNITIPKSVTEINGNVFDITYQKYFSGDIYVDKENLTFSDTATFTNRSGQIVNADDARPYNGIYEKQTNKTVYAVATNLGSPIRVTKETRYVYPGTISGNGSLIAILEEGVQRLYPKCINLNWLGILVIPSTMQYIYSSVAESHSEIYGVVCNAATPPRIITSSQSPTADNYHWTRVNSSKTAFLNNDVSLIIVPDGCKNAYKTASGWSYYADKIMEWDEAYEVALNHSDLTSINFDLTIEYYGIYSDKGFLMNNGEYVDGQNIV